MGTSADDSWDTSFDEDVRIRPAVRLGRSVAFGTVCRYRYIRDAGTRSRGVGQIAVQFTDAAGVAPNIASVVIGHAIPERQPGDRQGHTHQASTGTLKAVETAHVKVGAYLAEAQQVEAGGQ